MPIVYPTAYLLMLMALTSCGAGNVTATDSSASPTASASPIFIPSPTPTPTATPVPIPERTRERATQAIESFVTLSSKLKVGMIKADYTREVGDVRVEVDRFSMSPMAKEHPAYQDIVDTMQHYQFAISVWECYFDAKGTHSFMPYDRCYGEILENVYQVKPDIIVERKLVYYPSALSAIWSKARTQVESLAEQL